MFARKELRFNRGSVLSASQLRAIEKFPREFLRLYFSEFGDGILSGMNYILRDDEIFLTPGILKFNDEIYFADEENLSALAKKFLNGENFQFVLSDECAENAENVIAHKIFIEVKKVEKDSSAMEFGNFSSQKSFSLPEIDAENLREEFTRNSRIKILNVPYSVRGGSTFHPYIFRAVLNKLEQKKNPSPADIALKIHLANFEVASIPALKIYVESNDCKWLDGSRRDIFKSVLDAIDTEWKIKLPEKVSSDEQIKSQVKQSQNSFFI